LAQGWETAKLNRGALPLPDSTEARSQHLAVGSEAPQISFPNPTVNKNAEKLRIFTALRPHPLGIASLLQKHGSILGNPSTQNVTL
jgi:hypothetical protein